MKLEDAIQQRKPFPNPRQRMVVNLLYTSNWLISRQKEFFKRFDITVQQFNVLRILRGRHPEPISTSDIRGRMLDRMSDVSRIVDRLVKKDMVIRTTCKQDKRLVDVVITDKGLSLLSSIDAQWEELDSLTSTLSLEEVQIMNDLLDKFRENE